MLPIRGILCPSTPHSPEIHIDLTGGPGLDHTLDLMEEASGMTGWSGIKAALKSHARWCPLSYKWVGCSYNAINYFDISPRNHSDIGLINLLSDSELGHQPVG